jgi:endo-1,4-beta-xylanase
MSKAWPISRRRFLEGSAAASAFPLQARSREGEYVSLRTLGARCGIPYGISEPTRLFESNRHYYERLTAEAGLYVPGNEFHWANIEKQRGSRDYSRLEAVAKFMKARGVGLVGHTLLWHHTVPQWCMSLEDKGDLQGAIDAYVSETVARFSGHVVRWDVINEQINAGEQDGLRSSYFLRTLGPDYMKRAFAVARTADPEAMLCYNEYGFEYRRPDQYARRKAFLRLLQRFRDENVEVDCVGFQSHLDASMTLDFDGLHSFARQVTGLGYRVAITELDVLDDRIEGDDAERDEIVAQHVRDYLGCVFAVVKPLTVTSWGFTDDHTWLVMHHRRTDGRPLRPLPFDKTFTRKAQWRVLAEFLGR